MAKQYEILKPFALPFFRSVEVGELVTLDPDHIEQYELADSVKEISSKRKKAIAEAPQSPE